MALLMAGSIFSFTFFFTGSNPPSSPASNLPLDSTISPPITAISFTATGVEVTVQTLFPTVLLTASTKEGEISVIDSSILGINGIKRINNSFYRQPTAPSLVGPIVYVAELSVQTDASHQEIAQLIEELGIFSDSSIFSIGLVNLPQTVIFENFELNLTQEHTFSNPSAQAYMNLGTTEGDKIFVTLQAQLASQNLQNLLAFEESAQPTTPQLVQLKQEFEITELKSTLLFSSQIDLSQTSNLGEIEEKIKELENVTGATLEFTPTSDPLTIVFEESAIIFEEDLETFFTGFEGVTDFEIEIENKQAKVFFDPEIDFLQFQTDIITEMNSFSFTVKESIEPKARVEGTINSTLTDLVDLSTSVNSVLEENKILEISFFQEAKAVADQIVNEETGETFIVEEGFFDAQINLGHSNAEIILFDVLLITSNGEILSISAFEVQKVEE